MTISPVGALSTKWREEAERHKTHGDCYRKGQGWGLADAADELDEALAAQQAQELSDGGSLNGPSRLGASQNTDTGGEIRQASPIPLSAAHEQAAKEWAADDRLWTTQDTVEFNLRAFARVILKHQFAAQQAAITAIRQEMQQALHVSDESTKGGGGYWIKGHTCKTIKRWLAVLDAL